MGWGARLNEFPALFIYIFKFCSIIKLRILNLITYWKFLKRITNYKSSFENCYSSDVESKNKATK